MARRKKVKKSTIVKIIVISSVLLIAAVIGIIFLKRYVTNRFADSKNSYISVEASVSDLSTTVSGTGALQDSDSEEFDIPDNVEIDEVIVKVGDKVKEGDTLAKVNTNSVLSAMYEIQKQMDTIDAKLQDASKEKAAQTIKSKVKGRVKAIYVTKNSNVVTTMTEKNALMILSLDGYMGVDIDAGSLTKGTKVKVKVGKTTYTGTVNKIADGKAKVLITDNGPALNAEATVTSTDGKSLLGAGNLYVNSPLSIVAYAGKVTSVKVKVNQSIKKNKVLLELANTAYTANFDKLIKEREDLSEQLSDLLKIYNDGAILSQLSGTIKTIPETEDSGSSSSTSSAASQTTGRNGMSGYGGYSGYGNYGQSSGNSSSSTTTASDVFTICPDKKMTISVSVDETDILSISKNQSADVSIDSLDMTVKGVITDIDKSGTTADGTVGYTAEITIDKTEGMLSGMSATVLIAVTEEKNSVVIPIEALNNTGSSYFVYTTYDADNNTPGGMVEVTVGIMNGEYAQITSGLKEGDIVWYKDDMNPFERYMERANGGNNRGGNSRGGNNRGGNNRGGNNHGRTRREPEAKS